MSCPAVLGPGGLWCSGTALGSATWVFRASVCRFQERAFPPQLSGVRASQHSSHMFSTCHKKNRLSVLLAITISQTIREPQNNIRQRRACFRRTVVRPPRLVWLACGGRVPHFQISPRSLDSRFRLIVIAVIVIALRVSLPVILCVRDQFCFGAVIFKLPFAFYHGVLGLPWL